MRNKTLWQRIKSVASLLFASAAPVANIYEAGRRYSPDRSYQSSGVYDARFDANSASRYVMVEKAREFERNSALVNRLVDLFEQYTTGAGGLAFIPSSSDQEWNRRAKQWFDEWCKVCDISSRHSFATLQSLIAREWFVDGEVFVLKCYGSNQGKGQPPRPRIQLIESHRVGSVGGFGSPDMIQYPEQAFPAVLDGIEFDANARPVAYHVKVNDKVERIASDYIEHIFEPSRIGQFRGLPFLYPVMDDITDLSDLQRYEMKAAKSNAVTSNVITNAAGEITDDDVVRQGYLNSSKNSLGESTDEERAKYYRAAFGGETKVLKTGDKFEVFASERPGVAQQAYWDFLISKICAGVGISKLLVLPYTLQGTVTRSDLDVSNTFFRSRSSVLASHFERIYLFAIGWAKDWDPALKGAPKDWDRVVIRPPRSVNVDVGRNSAADLAELAAGATNYQTLYADRGDDWREQLTQRADEAAFINQLAKDRSESGVTAGQISELAAQEVAAPMPKTTNRFEYSHE